METWLDKPGVFTVGSFGGRVKMRRGPDGMEYAPTLLTALQQMVSPPDAPKKRRVTLQSFGQAAAGARSGRVLPASSEYDDEEVA